jgi:cation diffusion facilitator CzcD-associated flavoprotein CzcO
MGKRVDDQTKRICVIGGGPAGLAVLKIIADSPPFQAGQWTVDPFEARENVGGIW